MTQHVIEKLEEIYRSGFYSTRSAANPSLVIPIATRFNFLARTGLLPSYQHDFGWLEIEPSISRYHKLKPKKQSVCTFENWRVRFQHYRKWKGIFRHQPYEEIFLRNERFTEEPYDLESDPCILFVVDPSNKDTDRASPFPKPGFVASTGDAKGFLGKGHKVISDPKKRATMLDVMEHRIDKIHKRVKSPGNRLSFA